MEFVANFSENATVKKLNIGQHLPELWTYVQLHSF